MDVERIAEYLKQPDVLKFIIGRYRGPYSLGVTVDPGNPTGFAISLRIASSNIAGIPESLEVDGQKIPILAYPNFVAPIPI